MTTQQAEKLPSYTLMDNVKLIYFPGCPNYVVAKKLLFLSGYKFEEVNQSKLHKNHPSKRYTSPTILKNGKLIIGEKMDSCMGGCSTQLPDGAELKKRLET